MMLNQPNKQEAAGCYNKNKQLRPKQHKVGSTDCNTIYAHSYNTSAPQHLHVNTKEKKLQFRNGIAQTNYKLFYKYTKIQTE